MSDSNPGLYLLPYYIQYILLYVYTVYISQFLTYGSYEMILTRMCMLIYIYIYTHTHIYVLYICIFISILTCTSTYTYMCAASIDISKYFASTVPNVVKINV
jgi:hypothetical protein